MTGHGNNAKNLYSRVADPDSFARDWDQFRDSKYNTMMPNPIRNNNDITTPAR